MSALADATTQMLEPHVGAVIAQGCLRAVGQAAGKTPETIGPSDWPAVEATVRGFLRPVAPPGTIDSLIERIKAVGGV
ncbi:MAG: hypothetical protein FDZ70_05295 [Actinobacteria bacterium]|nr:MAG: hypothetical protein FDZ70_05295 [Actinomycetota bacterium]